MIRKTNDEKVKSMRYEYICEKIHCKSCVMLIEDILADNDAKNIEINEDSKTVEFDMDKAYIDEVLQELEDEGYPLTH